MSRNGSITKSLFLIIPPASKYCLTARIYSFCPKVYLTSIWSNLSTPSKAAYCRKYSYITLSSCIRLQFKRGKPSISRFASNSDILHLTSLMAGACANRTHQRRDCRLTNGFEVRADHQAGSAPILFSLTGKTRISLHSF